ncbi:4Fe-4S dicluster domain-containing protein [Candidatus Thorarchaeota archaeon]|nr:MAG: 4Fe-4S dicluster domain-containing protein [Candidatus Thorarchaeota archaeon]
MAMAKKARAIIIDSEFCKGCHLCTHICPHDVLETSDEVDNRGFYLPVVKDLESCRVCHLCEMHCPDFAIAVVEEE